MDEEKLIAKKEVLRVTGISYGQLYRWKRMGLIPESWFIRRSTFTGQETVFPKEKILSRIQEILRLKQGHPLEEVVTILAPETVPEKVGRSDPLTLPPIGSEGRELLWKEGVYTFPELVALAVGAAAIRRGAHPTEANLLVALLSKNQDLVRAPSGMAAVLGEKAVNLEHIEVRLTFAVLGREPVHLDPEAREKVHLDLEKIVEEMKLVLGGERR